MTLSVWCLVFIIITKFLLFIASRMYVLKNNLAQVQMIYVDIAYVIIHVFRWIILRNVTCTCHVLHTCITMLAGMPLASVLRLCTL